MWSPLQISFVSVSKWSHVVSIYFEGIVQQKVLGSNPSTPKVLVLKVDKLDKTQVTYLDPAGLITWENGSDMRDATTYKFNAYVRTDLRNSRSPQ
jgi:hypothetical protein